MNFSIAHYHHVVLILNKVWRLLFTYFSILPYDDADHQDLRRRQGNAIYISFLYLLYLAFPQVNLEQKPSIQYTIQMIQHLIMKKKMSITKSVSINRQWYKLTLNTKNHNATKFFMKKHKLHKKMNIWNIDTTKLMTLNIVVFDKHWICASETSCYR